MGKRCWRIQEENSDLHMPEDIAASMPKPVQVYESKAQKYEDLKSSASAFLIAIATSSDSTRGPPQSVQIVMPSTNSISHLGQ